MKTTCGKNIPFTGWRRNVKVVEDKIIPTKPKDVLGVSLGNLSSNVAVFGTGS